MKLWIDDVRPAPEGYVWCTTVNQAKMVIIDETVFGHLELIDNLLYIYRLN